MNADALSEFLTAIRSHGLEPDDDIVADGELHRCKWRGDSNGTKNGAYALHLDGCPAGFFMCFKRDIKKTWRANGERPDPAFMKKLRAKMEAEQARRKEEERERHQEKAEHAQAYLFECRDADADHEYLQRKQVEPHGLKVGDDGRLVVPMRDAEGKIWSLQVIAPNGTKRFLKGGRKAGLFHLIGDPGDEMVIAEGFATAASIREATRLPVVIAFDAGNLASVARAVREWWPRARIAMAADDDHLTDGNPGLTKAKAAAELIGASVAVPVFLDERRTDFNDMAVLCGREAVAAVIRQALAPPPAYTLAEVHAVFRRWLGDEYDIHILNAVLATAAAEKLPGDPLWLLVISGPGSGKTETVSALRSAGAHVTSTISSEGALLSASPRREHGKDATGGLLRKIGDRGLLVIKDVTSILSAHRDLRSAVLAAMREIYDGRWERNVGTDGGKTLTWEGRIGAIGAVTTAWDQAHGVISAMGDRFVLIRADSYEGRSVAARRAIANTGHEQAMREEMAEAVRGLLATVDPGQRDDMTTDEIDRIMQAANLVTLARTGVEFDYRGDVIDAHAPEMPTRFAKQLTQIFRGSLAIGMSRENAFALAIRCARDSMPPLRLELLRDVAEHPGSRVIDIRRRIEKPRTTTDRQLQALHILRLLSCREEEEDRFGKKVQVRFYSLAEGIDPHCLTVPEMSINIDWEINKREGEKEEDARIVCDISGNGLADSSGEWGYF
jgi:phage/plasmid primase-like uncharacterized protein